MNYVTVAIPFFILLMAAECLWGQWRGHQTYRVNDALSSLYLGLMSRVMGLLRLGFGSIVTAWLVSLVGITPIQSDSAWLYVGAFIAYDFLYYWKHRYGHEWRIMWASHVAHHQSEEYNLSTALRQTGTDYIGFVFYVPLFVAGVPAEVVITVGSLNLIYQFWVHTQHIRRLGPLEWVFVTPSNHRVHHAKNPEYIDKNYGGVFIIWDRLFGTFRDEDPSMPCRFGITHALQSWDPVRANLHVWVETARMAHQTANFADKFRIWFKPPSWTPADITVPDHDWQSPKYNPPLTVFLRWYCFAQYWPITAAGLATALFARDVSYTFSLAMFGLVVGSLYIHSQLLEARPFARWEWLRLAAVLTMGVAAPTIWGVPGWVAPVASGYCAISALAFWLGRHQLTLPTMTASARLS